ncbi:hypothetical protein PSHT_07337 [Puccinia striiformis]|uniref:Peptidase S54 rhomboid domain-containing protein n=1 Tax=Puccinia striiformis TaxID=27350 RepID=A0A2S4VYS6_9BASI|nr:hypothetical protein PSHT_07337 [Puccinia striiformis]
MSGRFMTSSGPIGLVLQLPTGTRLLCGILLALSILVQLLRFSLSATDLKAIFRGSTDDALAFPWLVVVPGSVIWNPWTLLTAGLCEVGVIELVFSLFTLIMCGRYLERVYGTTEFIKFCLTTIGVSNFISVIVNVAEHYVLQDSGMFLWVFYFFVYSIPIKLNYNQNQLVHLSFCFESYESSYGSSYRGMMALHAGFLVAFTQLIPEHQVQLFGVIKVRVKNLPMIYVGFSNVMCILGYQSPFILIQMGWLSSWYYLRFIRWNESGEFRGDRSETFAFAMWFPSFIQPLVRKLTDIGFAIAVKCKILKQWSHSDLESGGYAPVPGGARAEAERRSDGSESLDQRLASNKSTNVNSPPDPSNPLGVTPPGSRPTTTIPSPAQPTSTTAKGSPVFPSGALSQEPDSTAVKVDSEKR